MMKILIEGFTLVTKGLRRVCLMVVILLQFIDKPIYERSKVLILHLRDKERKMYVIIKRQEAEIEDLEIRTEI